ncbi:MATE family efflux transporter [Treponema zioleckii]|uniref:MATE family efflux transporter n=1 Tax=Treponema zioleckii TaxID=331680 RepID=UPI00168BC2DC|nr:MATE family efflux transporter [Treponema zioleckii]
MEKNQNQNKVVISEKEKLRREKMLYGNQAKILFAIALPLVFYNSIGQIFQFIDTFIAANMSAKVVSTVSFVAQIEKMLLAVGSGLSIGGGVLIGRSFGSGDMDKVRSLISTIFFIALSIGAAILVLVIPLMYPLLRLCKMPDELLAQGTLYSSLVVFSIIFQFVNTIFFSIQKARGDTKIIMWGNLLVIFLKTSINILTMNLIKNGFIENEKGIYFLPIATLIAHGSLTLIALKNLTSKKNPFRLSIKKCTFTKNFVSQLSGLSIPVFLEKFIFAMGKTIVNALCSGFSPTAVGALGVSDRICGFATNPINGFQEAESSLVSNNIGNKNIKRAISFFYRSLIFSTIFVLVVFTITGIFKSEIIGAFAKGNAEFAAEIDKIYFLERLDTILIAINVSVMGLLYGFGKTKVAMILNIVRLFVYRIPPLLIFMKVPFFYEKLGIYAVGLAMLISNSLVGITAGIVAVIFIRKARKNEN